jgi:hypothetical protein
MIKALADLTDAALLTVAGGIEGLSIDRIDDNMNILEMLDSFAVVDVVMETESLLERALGRYVPLADETIFDAEKSPFRSWHLWRAHVSALANG